MIRSLAGGLMALAMMAAGVAVTAAHGAGAPAIQKAAQSQTTPGMQNAPEIQKNQRIEKIAAYAGSWSIHIEHLPRLTAKPATSTRNCGMTAGGAAGITCDQYVEGADRVYI
jgi:hypothetical protein